MQIARLIALLAVVVASRPAGAALTRVDNFGSNPGALVMYEYVPAGLPSGRPVVVVLHGCTQTATAMEAAGWNKLADQHGFAVIYPEQQTANNPVRCFNWAGEYGDTANLVRGQGENQSIISMVDKAISSHGSSASKVYLVGFSAGGAFVAVMLATWPERFAGGAIMSGIPYRCATSVSGAYSCQSPGVSKTGAQWGDLVRAATTFTGTRPPLQIWHGKADSTVVPANELELIEQWTNVAGTDATADETTTIAGATRTVYKSGSRIVVEAFEVPSMGHATAVGGTGCVSTAGAYFEDRGICATQRAAELFGLAGGGGGPDAVAPTVSIASPADGSTVTGNVTIVVAASDNIGTSSVALSIDGVDQPADTEPPFQFPWDATAAGAGEHELVAVATDAAGNNSTATAHVSVPGPGGGSGSGSDDPDPPSGASDELPGCSLDATGGGAGIATLGFACVLVLARRRRS